ncbi:MAG: glycosyltransferase [Microbacteriaceae bacterium]|nr:glycosyltransferase [Microbacteriaceae bacterium]
MERTIGPDRPLRVILASRLYEPEAGAAPFRLAALVSRLESRGAEVTVMTTRPPSGERTTGRIRRWPVLRDRGGAVRGYLPYASFDVPLFLRLLFGPRADVVVVEPPPTTGVVVRITSWLRRRPYVYYSADVTTVAARGIGVRGPALRMVRGLERAAVRGAAAVLAVSYHVRDEVVALGAGPDRVHDVGTGIDTGVFTADGPVRDEPGPYLVYGGTMSEIQGAGVFIDALARIVPEHPEVRLHMFGQGVERDAIAARAEELVPGAVLFHDPVPGAELAPWLRGAAAALASVRPGRGYDFAFATKAFVALACGTPVVYAGVGPVGPLIAENRLGWVAEWDEEAVAAALREALRTTASAADRARRRAWATAHYSLHSVADRAAEIVEHAAHPRRTAAPGAAS